MENDFRYCNFMAVAKSLSVVPRGHARPRVIFGAAIPLRIKIRERCFMVKNSHGYRSRTRGLMSKRVRQKGLSSPSKVLTDYEEGQRVDIVIDPGFHKGMPHKRYHGRTGVVTGLRGRAVVVDVGLGNATKSLIIRREHLKPSKL